ncbi:hypothetical protein DFJ63DRAFT_320551 [Scheffersomyces coipomensis]|uniref:uncharacterized protein n=1 Tax=Scheffersomyces coipomensis TaxID=1788519 RepID=UPI00315D29B1
MRVEICLGCAFVYFCQAITFAAMVYYRLTGNEDPFATGISLFALLTYHCYMLFSLIDTVKSWLRFFKNLPSIDKDSLFQGIKNTSLFLYDSLHCACCLSNIFKRISLSR